ncbi:pyridoxal phosphate-dependent aminotransferase [Gryllotalpicola protaetiae]|uniref:Aminotransferase n=1 Tax=Gryllotalpicola protaetiae TaxID=2419771 RepID=A0A387BVG1_9MICO|nr:aminotransferase class I/II-fold pyridoxal phosphate-dependent enzyme [Gryllotalpicola protaetiae]AYG05096.1 aminotransferase class I/II-fold pyridoxal phosphate-dependent enzyme [Gryllotalpicola protaetiae]
MPELARHIASVPASGIRRVFEAAHHLPDVIMLAIGEPDAEPAPHIAAAAMRAWADGFTDYTPNGGVLEFREAVVDKLSRVNGIDVGVDQVWSTIGATQALYQAQGLVLDPADEILVPDPGYTTFTMAARMHSAVPVRYGLKAESGFLPQIADLEALVTPRTRALLVNSPSNPLGVVFPEQTLRDVLAFAARHDLWVISDEVYEYFAHGAPHVSIASLDRDDRVLSVFSLSKTYAMTGIRAGYLVTPPGFGDELRRVQEGSISCINAPAQYAAVAALTGPQDAVTDAAAHYRDNVARATALLRERGIRHYEPQGAFYLWIDVSHASGGDVQAWAERFVTEQRVAVAPGSAFGPSGEGWIRVCAASPTSDLLEGLSRLPSVV